MITVHVNSPGGPGPADLLRRAVRTALEAEGVTTAEVSVTLLDDHGIRTLNRRYLDRDRPTDVLAFPLHGEGEGPLGDVYVGLERARDQARGVGVPLEEELVRLAIHGTLHVLGWDHPEVEREGSPMFRRQEELVRQVLEER